MQTRRTLLAMLAALATTSAVAGPGLAAGRISAAAAMATPIGDPQAVVFFSQAVLAETNHLRRSRGLAPLRDEPRLATAALAHARGQARTRTMSHAGQGRGQGDLAARLKTAGVRYTVAAENIAMQKVYQIVGRPVTLKSVRSAGGSGTGHPCGLVFADNGQLAPTHSIASLAAAVVAQWYASPKDRANMLDPRVTRMGAGYAVDDGGPACGDVYLTQDFAG